MKTKHFLQILAMLFLVLSVNAQQGINYKAIINDSNGDALANASVTVQFTILENGTTDVFQETHSPTTDKNGIIIVNIGKGTVISGNFNTIDWGSNPHFLKTEIDAGGGLTDMGTTEFDLVPYALHAEKADISIIDNVEDDDPDPTNELQNISLAGKTLSISDGNDVNLPIETNYEEPGLLLDQVTFQTSSSQIREVLKLEFSISREMNTLGQPTSSPQIDVIRLKIAALESGDTELAEWICDPYDAQEGEIKYIGMDRREIRVLDFKDGYLISYKEYYDPELGLIEEIEISPREIRTGGAELDEGWGAMSK